MDIYFTESPNDKFFALTNLYPVDIKIGGEEEEPALLYVNKWKPIKPVIYKSSENLYQTWRLIPPVRDELMYSDAQREYAFKVNEQEPFEARDWGSYIDSNYQKENVRHLDNWNEIREDVMLNCLRAKFNQSEFCREKLLATGRASLHLQNNSVLNKNDPTEQFYWGTGKDSLGRDRLGALLETVRKELIDKERANY